MRRKILHTICLPVMAVLIGSAHFSAAQPGQLFEVCTADGCKMVDPRNPTKKTELEKKKDAAIAQETPGYQGESLSVLLEASRNGDPVASYKLGTVYDKGLIGMPKDEAKATALYKQAADGGVIPAARNVALLLLKDPEPAKPEAQEKNEKDKADAEKAEVKPKKAALPKRDPMKLQMGVRYLYQAANANDEVAMVELGRQLFTGDILSRDIRGAAKWFERSAELGSADAQYFIGQMHFRGKGRRQNGAEAIRWTRKAAIGGSVLGQRALGLLYVHGYETIRKDRVEADRWLTAAAQNGDIDSAKLKEILKSGGYLPSKGLISLLPAGDIIEASDAAKLAISQARSLLAEGKKPSEAKPVSFGSGDGQEVTIKKQTSDFCFDYEVSYRVGGEQKEDTQNACF